MSPKDAVRSGSKLCSSSINIEPTSGKTTNQTTRVRGNAKKALTVRQKNPAQ